LPATGTGIVEVTHNDTPTPSLLAGWSNFEALDFANGPEPIYPFNESTATPGNTFRPTAYPSVAIDPSNPQFVYVVFSASSQPHIGSGDDQDIDLYIAQSIDGGQTFPVNRRLRITNAQLGDAVGTDQFMPSITIDQYGGVNLLYFRIGPTAPHASDAIPEPDVVVEYARIASFAVPLSQTIVVRHLTLPWRAVSALQDYLTIASSGCNIYACYPKAEGDGLSQNVYISRISACVADVDSDGVVDEQDIAAFTTAYLTAQAPADVDQDGVVSSGDIQTFVTGYSCGCGVPP
jgi:hypothetical protein